MVSVLSPRSFPFKFFLLPDMLFALLFLSYLPLSVLAADIRIDDSNSTFFQFNNGWNIVSPSSPCAGCWIKPDPESMNGGTWHDGGPGGNAAAVVKFFGTAISIVGIDVNDNDPGQAGATFRLDNNALETYDSPRGTSKDLRYNAVLYRATNLSPDTEHTLSWTVINSSTQGASLVIDYAVVTVPDTPAPVPPTSQSSSRSSSSTTSSSSSTSSSSATSSTPTDPGDTRRPASPSSSTAGGTSNPNSSGGTTSDSAPNAENTGDSQDPVPVPSKTPIGPIVGGVAGGLVLIALILFLLWRHRRKRGDISLPETGNNDVQPFYSDSAPYNQLNHTNSSMGMSQQFAPVRQPQQSNDWTGDSLYPSHQTTPGSHLASDPFMSAPPQTYPAAGYAPSSNYAPNSNYAPPSDYAPESNSNSSYPHSNYPPSNFAVANQQSPSPPPPPSSSGGGTASALGARMMTLTYDRDNETEMRQMSRPRNTKDVAVLEDRVRELESQLAQTAPPAYGT